MNNDFKTLAPSSASRRMACPGSYGLENLYAIEQVFEQTNDAKEGELAHTVAMSALKGVKLSDPKITLEMLEGAKLYKKYILQTTRVNLTDLFKGDANYQFGLEQKIDISCIHPYCSGAPDFWIYVDGTLYLFDYKFGHSFVDVYENWQLIEYAAGILELLKTTGYSDQFITVHFAIIQPRYYQGDTIRTWKIRACNLRPYFNKLINAEAAAVKEDAICQTSNECNYCTARYACKALQNSVMQIYDHISDNTPREFSPVALGFELRNLKYAAKLLKAMITGLEAQALALIKSGKQVSNFHIGYTKPHQQWLISADEVQALGELYNVNLLKKQEPITPRQAILAGVDEDLVKQATFRPPGEMVLIESTEEDAKKFFNQTGE